MEKFTVSSSSSPKYITDLDAISEKIEKAVKDKDIIKYKDAYNEQYNTMKQHLIEDKPDFPPKTFTDVSEHIDYLLGMILMMKAKHEVEQCEDAEIIARLMHRIDALEAKEKGRKQMLDTLFTLILFIFAGLIAIGLLFKRNMWPLICAYWITQFIRYAITLVSNL